MHSSSHNSDTESHLSSAGRLRHPNMGQLACSTLTSDGLQGFVVIDSTVDGRSHGGLRLAPDLTADQIALLARTMTLKYGFLGLPLGGSKAGLRTDPEASPVDRRRWLAAFAQAISPLIRSGLYLPAPDLGTGYADIRQMLADIGLKLQRRQMPETQSGYYTALTVLESARAAASRLGLVLSGRTAAIEGFGSVGSALGRLLTAAGARVVAVSTSQGAIYSQKGLDTDVLSRMSEHIGSQLIHKSVMARRMEPERLLELPVDLLCLCAGSDSVNLDNADAIQARIICPGANHPVTSEAAAILDGRGVLCLPDFVANSGGVLGTLMTYACISPQRIESLLLRNFGGRVDWLLGQAETRGVEPRLVAEDIAMRRRAALKEGEAGFAGLWHLARVGLALHRRGLIPGPLVAGLALPYFARRLRPESDGSSPEPAP